MVLKPLGITGGELSQELCPVAPGEFNAISERLEVHRVTVALAQAEHQINRAAHKGRQHIWPM